AREVLGRVGGGRLVREGVHAQQLAAQRERGDREGRRGDEDDAAHAATSAVRAQQGRRLGHGVSPRLPRGTRAVPASSALANASSIASSAAITSATIQLSSRIDSVEPSALVTVVGAGGSSIGTSAERCWYSTPSSCAICSRFCGSIRESARSPW